MWKKGRQEMSEKLPISDFYKVADHAIIFRNKKMLRDSGDNRVLRSVSSPCICGSRPANFQSTQGYFIPQAQKIKKVVNIPVIGVGGITEPEYADSLIQEGRVDLVAVGRALLEDPDWAINAIETLKRR